jgi:hypothetical protein
LFKASQKFAQKFESKLIRTRFSKYRWYMYMMYLYMMYLEGWRSQIFSKQTSFPESILKTSFIINFLVTGTYAPKGKRKESLTPPPPPRLTGIVAGSIRTEKGKKREGGEKRKEEKGWGRVRMEALTNKRKRFNGREKIAAAEQADGKQRSTFERTGPGRVGAGTERGGGG